MKSSFVKLTYEQKQAFMDIVEAIYLTKVNITGALPIHFAFALNRITAMVYSSTLILEEYNFYVDTFKAKDPKEWSSNYRIILGDEVKLWETESDSDSN
jgi:hypothetical protein